ncbi:MAG: hypothetical protein CMJ50_03105 [Planctomycetaceae bacterium]|jgi:hypothetical protein|nr:hypothetical protein [Planctomycetaceae bacterium]
MTSRATPRITTASPILKTVWDPEDIRSRLPASGGVGFLFHATDPTTIAFAFDRFPDDPEELWKIPPFVGSPIFWDNRVIGAHVISPLPATLWATGHAGIKRFRESGYKPMLELAERCGLTHLGLAALLPLVIIYLTHHEPWV